VFDFRFKNADGGCAYVRAFRPPRKMHMSILLILESYLTIYPV